MDLVKNLEYRSAIQKKQFQRTAPIVLLKISDKEKLTDGL